MGEERVKIEVQQLIHKRNNLITILLVTTSGIIGLIYNLNNPVSLILLFIGIPATITFARGLLNIEEKITSLIKEIEK